MSRSVRRAVGRPVKRLCKDCTERAWGEDGVMALAAFRYALGRRTYITGICADWLVSVWDDLPAPMRRLIQQEIEDAFRAHAEQQSGGGDRWCGPLGDPCDIEAWARVRRLWAE
jgi:hypothetical protein